MMTHGKMEKQPDGRLAGHVMEVLSRRRDGKYSVQHRFGSGRRINKIYTQAQLDAEIAKFAEEECGQ